MLALSAMTSTAFAAGKPVVKTSAATSITTKAASLNGTVKPEGLETTYYFEYGTTESYGSKTAEVSAGSGTKILEETAHITGLAANKKYDFRIVARNSDGTVDGSNLSFTTKAPEFSPADGQTMTSTGGEFQMEEYSGIITCKNETTAGNVTGKYTVGKVNVTFTGCTVTPYVGVGPCNIESQGAKNSGEIVIRPLKGQLGVVSTTDAPSGVGLLLEPETTQVWTTLAGSENAAKETCSIETTMSGQLALGVGVLGSDQLTNKLTAAVYEGWNIREITLASGETVKPKLTTFGQLTPLTGVDDVTFGQATEVTI